LLLLVVYRTIEVIEKAQRQRSRADMEKDRMFRDVCMWEAFSGVLRMYRGRLVPLTCRDRMPGEGREREKRGGGRGGE
jgi:hypothetical protein